MIVSRLAIARKLRAMAPSERVAVVSRSCWTVTRTTCVRVVRVATGPRVTRATYACIDAMAFVGACACARDAVRIFRERSMDVVDGFFMLAALVMALRIFITGAHDGDDIDAAITRARGEDA